MLPVDFLKALGVALLVMLLDLACAFVGVTLWSLWTQPPQPLSPSDPAVITVATLTTRLCGPLLLALFVWLFSRRRPDRNAWAFGVAVFVFYMLVDWGMVAFRGMLEPAALLTAALKLAGAMVGAWFAQRGGPTANG